MRKSMSKSNSCRAAALAALTCAGISSCSEHAVYSERVVGKALTDTENNGNGAWHQGSDSVAKEQGWTVDSFDQSSKTKLDVLWVIDNSASMDRYQDELANNIHSFMDGVSSWDADLQMGVTSTDMCVGRRPTDLSKVMCPDRLATAAGLQGKLAGGKVISGSDANAVDEFNETARLGTNGSSFEHGLSAAKAAVELSLKGENHGLVRDDAFLAVILVSDEEDDGVGLSSSDEQGKNWWASGHTRYRFTAEDLVSYLGKVKPNGMFSVSSVVGLSRNPGKNTLCSSSGSLEVGNEQMKASKMTGGKTLDLCSAHWSAGLNAMAEDFSAQVSSFRLTSSPNSVTGMEVLIDGVPVPAGWTYVPSRQMVVFSKEALPGFGARIEVRYQK